jgi:hypothetical protein
VSKPIGSNSVKGAIVKYVTPFTVFDSFSHPFLSCECLYSLSLGKIEKYFSRELTDYPIDGVRKIGSC